MTTIRITSPQGRETTADLASMLTPELREQEDRLRSQIASKH